MYVMSGVMDPSNYLRECIQKWKTHTKDYKFLKRAYREYRHIMDQVKQLQHMCIKGILRHTNHIDSIRKSLKTL